MSELPKAEGCAAPDPRLTALLDGELRSSERQQLEQHLRACARCAADLSEQRLAREALRQAAGALQPPRDLQDRVQERLKAEARPRRLRRALFAALTAAALAVLAALSLVFWTRQVANARVIQRAVQVHQSETLGPSPVTFASSDGAAVAAWVQRQIGRSIDVPALDGAGYQLSGARLEGGVASKAVALIYISSATSLTCIIVPAAALPGASEDIGLRQVRGAAVAAWADDDDGYIMVADVPPQQLLAVARSAQHSASSPADSPDRLASAPGAGVTRIPASVDDKSLQIPGHLRAVG